MSSGRRNYVKRERKQPKDRERFSRNIREISEDIQRHRHDRALRRIDQLLADSSTDTSQRARLLAQIGDGEFAKGRFQEAATIYLQSAAASLEESRIWLRFYIGEVRALLKIPQVDRAIQMAQHAVALSKAKMDVFEEAVRSANDKALTGEDITVPPLPFRPSVVATRMGYLFLQEGELDAAADFFNVAISHAKKGANRARQGLAEIAILKQEQKEAYQTSVDALWRGKFHKKTISAWKTLIRARRKAGSWRIRKNLLRNLEKMPPGVRARTTLLIVRELRNHGMNQWKEVAHAWLNEAGAEFPIVAVEIQKLFLASSRYDPSLNEDKEAVLESFLESPLLSANEWLMGAKMKLSLRLQKGQTPDINGLLKAAGSRYGRDILPAVRYKLAAACGREKRNDLQRKLLDENVQSSRDNLIIWSKSLWKLAKMEEEQGDYRRAAALYERIASHIDIESGIRAQSQLHRIQALLLSGGAESLAAAAEPIKNTLRKVREPVSLLNMARQLHALDDPALAELSEELFSKGEALAVQQFNEASQPQAALTILSKLTHRQIVDFDRASSALRMWEEMSPDKKLWLWMDHPVFWEYIGLLVRGYFADQQPTKAEQIAWEWLMDPSTPPSGLVHIGIPLCRYYLNSQQVERAFQLFERITMEAPTERLSVLAWYWMALAAHRDGLTEKRNHCITALRLAAGATGGVVLEQELKARAAMLLADLDVARIDIPDPDFTSEHYTLLIQHINHEMGMVP